MGLRGVRSARGCPRGWGHVAQLGTALKAAACAGPRRHLGHGRSRPGRQTVRRTAFHDANPECDGPARDQVTVSAQRWPSGPPAVALSRGLSSKARIPCAPGSQCPCSWFRCGRVRPAPRPRAPHPAAVAAEQAMARRWGRRAPPATVNKGTRVTHPNLAARAPKRAWAWGTARWVPRVSPGWMALGVASAAARRTWSAAWQTATGV